MRSSAIVTYLLNGVWQLTALAVLVFAADLLLRRAPAAIRWRLWQVALLATPLLPLLTLPGLRPRALTPAVIFEVDAAASLPAPQAASLGLFCSLAWGAFVLWRGVVLYRSWHALGRLRETGVRVAGLHGAFESMEVAAPVTFGDSRPVILLPAGLAKAAILPAVLAHESAHIARRDYLWNLVTELVTLPVSWHPAVWLVKRRASAIREMACDEMAAAETPGYARMLLQAARMLAEKHHRVGSLQPVTLGMFDSDQMEERITTLMNQTTRWSRARAGWAAGLAMAGMLAGAAGLSHWTAGVAYGADDVHKVGGDVLPPKLIHKVEPKYSPAAKDAKVEGRVKLYVEVTPDGEPDKVKVVEGLHPELDQNAITAVNEWRFAPATKSGKAVRCAATIEVNFRLE